MGRAAAIAAVLSVGFIFLLLLWPTSQSEITAKLEPLREYEAAIKARDVTPKETLPGPRFEDGVLERLPGKKPPPPPKPKPKPLNLARVEVIEAGILKSGEHIIHLDHIHSLSLEEQCSTDEGKDWPCGRFARTELRQFIRNRTIECKDVAEVQTKIKTRCRLDNYDISAWLVLTGWAKPVDPYFEKEFAEAKAKKRGQWRTVRP